ncbi:glycosyltransferase family 2 protein [Pseudonocardia kujensis]|uniref:glycosyltransferase family 2 protein n=1 Tax=Pseudonocardia kujensis TaxID=1128675 RepID=UPI001E4D4E06|nr:glycosyltransferase family A protein [Pseudonocardia kujensis]MCE0763127.1 glycosyltransferase family 2 protein [Pseudonocardia kujensis]
MTTTPGRLPTTGEQPLFSILTSAYRTEAYLSDTIESVQGQTLADWELIVVDNGMSDDVAEIVSCYRDDPRIRLVRQENKGLGGGVDAAAAVARGRYYAVLDSDDLLMPAFCERTAAVLAERPEVDVVGIDAYVFEDGDDRDWIRSYRQSLGITTPPDPERSVDLVTMIGGEVLYYTAAIRAEAWVRAKGYSCSTPKVEDLAMFLRLVVAGCDVRVLDERLARYRLRTDSSSRDPAHADSFEANLERAFIDASKLTPAPEVDRALELTLRRIRYHQALRHSRTALLQGDTDAALRAALRAFAQRRTVRPAAVIAGLALAPGLMRRLHPVKQRWSRTAAGLVRDGRHRVRVVRS